MLIVVRHGRTSFNEDGTEKLRGWLPISLTLDGMKEAHETAESLEDIEGIDHLYCSDLVRSVQTAAVIAEELSIVLEPKEELRDWDYGDLTGEEVERVLPKIHAFMADPSEKVPGGEPYQHFLDRCVPFLREIVESDELILAVTHARVITMLKAMCVNEGGEPDMDILKKKCPIEPSGIMVISRKWKVAFQTEVDQ